MFTSDCLSRLSTIHDEAIRVISSKPNVLYGSLTLTSTLDPVNPVALRDESPPSCLRPLGSSSSVASISCNLCHDNTMCAVSHNTFCHRVISPDDALGCPNLELYDLANPALAIARVCPFCPFSSSNANEWLVHTHACSASPARDLGGHLGDHQGALYLVESFVAVGSILFNGSLAISNISNTASGSAPSLPMPSTSVVPMSDIFDIAQLPNRCEIITAQSNCEWCCMRVRYLTTKTRPKDKLVTTNMLSAIRKDFKFDVHSGLLLRVPSRKRQSSDSDDCVFKPAIVIPPSNLTMQRTIGNYFHASLDGGHGFSKTVEFKTRGYFWWPGLISTIESICDSCVHCKASKSYPSHNAPQFPIYRSDHYHTLHVDLFKFKVPGSDAIGSIIVYDPFNHFLRGNIIESECMEGVADWLFTEVFLKCGKPTKLVFDTQFNVNEVNSVLKILAILGGKSWPYVHNGVAAERPIRFLVECMRTMLSAAKEKIGISAISIAPKLFHYAMAAYNAAPIPGTYGITPFFHEYGRHYNLPGLSSDILELDRLNTLPTVGLAESSVFRRKLLLAVNADLNRLHLNNSCSRALKYNIGKGCRIYDIGDNVAVTLEHRQSKLNPVANPNYEILARVSQDAYRVRNNASKRSTIRIADHLKKLPTLPDLQPGSIPSNNGQTPPKVPPPIHDITVTEDGLETIPFTLKIGLFILFKKRHTSRIYIGEILSGDASNNLWCVHLLMHQVSSSFPKVNGCGFIDMFEPLCRRKLLFEYTYYDKNQVLLTCGFPKRRPTGASKFSPVIIDLNPSEFDVLGVTDSFVSSNRKWKLGREVIRDVTDVINSWDPARGVAPLGVVRSDSTPTSCAVQVFQCKS